MELPSLVLAAAASPTAYFCFRPFLRKQNAIDFVRAHRWVHPNWICVWRTLISWSGLWSYFAIHNFAGIFIYTTGAMGDALDGFLARTCGLETKTGEWLDPLADKLTYLPALATFAGRGFLDAYLIIILIIIEAFGQFAVRKLLMKLGLPIKAIKWGKIKAVILFGLVIFCALADMTGNLGQRCFQLAGNSILALAIILAIGSIIFKVIPMPIKRAAP